MKQILAGTVGLAFILALAHPYDVVMAQGPVKQIQLTDKQIEGFLKSQGDMAMTTKKTEGSTSDTPDPKIQADLESVAKKYGFKDLAEFDDVADNIAMVMAGINPQTKAFLEPKAAIAKEMEEVTADKALPEDERKKMLDELSEASKTAAPIQYPGNIELIKKYFDRLDAALK